MTQAVQRITSDEVNFWVSNVLAQTIVLLMLDIASKVETKFHRLAPATAELNKVIGRLNQTVLGNMDAEQTASYFRQRSYKGCTPTQLLVSSVNHNIMQLEPIDAYISALWSGTSNFEVSIMHSSFTYSLLVEAPLS